MKRRCCDGFKKPRFDRDVLAITKQRWFSSSSNKCGRKTKKNPGYARNWESERNRRSSFWKYRHRYSGTWYRENHRSKEEKNTTASKVRRGKSKEEENTYYPNQPFGLALQSEKKKQTNKQTTHTKQIRKRRRKSLAYTCAPQLVDRFHSQMFQWERTKTHHAVGQENTFKQINRQKKGKWNKIRGEKDYWVWIVQRWGNSHHSTIIHVFLGDYAKLC